VPIGDGACRVLIKRPGQSSSPSENRSSRNSPACGCLRVMRQIGPDATLKPIREFSYERLRPPGRRFTDRSDTRSRTRIEPGRPWRH